MSENRTSFSRVIEHFQHQYDVPSLHTLASQRLLSPALLKVLPGLDTSIEPYVQLNWEERGAIREQLLRGVIDWMISSRGSLPKWLPGQLRNKLQDAVMYDLKGHLPEDRDVYGIPNLLDSYLLDNGNVLHRFTTQREIPPTELAQMPFTPDQREALFVHGYQKDDSGTITHAPVLAVTVAPRENPIGEDPMKVWQSRLQICQERGDEAGEQRLRVSYQNIWRLSEEWWVHERRRWNRVAEGKRELGAWELISEPTSTEGQRAYRLVQERGERGIGEDVRQRFVVRAPGNMYLFESSTKPTPPIEQNES